MDAVEANPGVKTYSIYLSDRLCRRGWVGETASVDEEKERGGEVEQVKGFHLPASVRLYPAHTPGAARHGNKVLCISDLMIFDLIFDDLELENKRSG